MSFKVHRTNPKPDTRDIVDWLRQLVNQRIAAFGERGMDGCRYGEAADAIEKMRAALKPFADVADDFDADGRKMKDSVGIYANTAGDFRRAREALNQQTGAEKP